MREEAANDFIEMMGRHLEEEGTARIAGRLLGLLMLIDDPVSLDEAAERLQVSKGSISMNARLLETWGVAERVTRPGDRRDFYRIVPDLGTRLLERQIERVKLINERIGAALPKLEPLSEVVRGRMDRAVKFNDLAIRTYGTMLDEVRGASGE